MEKLSSNQTRALSVMTERRIGAVHIGSVLATTGSRWIWPQDVRESEYNAITILKAFEFPIDFGHD